MEEILWRSPVKSLSMTSVLMHHFFTAHFCEAYPLKVLLCNVVDHQPIFGEKLHALIPYLFPQCTS